jgi:hypothetical protein
MFIKVSTIKFMCSTLIYFPLIARRTLKRAISYLQHNEEFKVVGNEKQWGSGGGDRGLFSI